MRQALQFGKAEPPFAVDYGQLVAAGPGMLLQVVVQRLVGLFTGSQARFDGRRVVIDFRNGHDGTFSLASSTCVLTARDECSGSLTVIPRILE